MKKLALIMMLCIAAMLQTNPVVAQESSFQPSMVVKTNPVAALGGPFWVIIVPITGEYRAMFEIKTLPKQSLMVGASYLGPSLLINLDQLTTDSANVSGINTSGYRLQGMYKFYISRTDESLEGLYVGPHFTFSSASIASKDNPNDKISGAILKINGVIGYQLIAESGFALDIYTGLGYRSRQFSVQGDAGSIFDFGNDKASPSVTFGLNFGFAF